MSSGRPSCSPSLRTSSLNRSRSGSISSKPSSAGRPPTLWCSLILAAWPVGACRRTRSRRGRACPGRGSGRLGIRAGLVGKHSMKACPMRRRFSCGSVTPARAARNCSAAWTTCRSVLKWSREVARHRLRLVLPQQAVVDEDARQLRADRPVQQGGHDRGIDAAREPADHPAVADPLGGSSRPLARRNRPPTCPAAADRCEEVVEDLRAQRRVGDLGMKLHAVDRQPATATRSRRSRPSSCRWPPPTPAPSPR